MPKNVEIVCDSCQRMIPQPWAKTAARLKIGERKYFVCTANDLKCLGNFASGTSRQRLLAEMAG